MINLKTKNWEIDNIDTVLFDKDGTLIDLHYFWGKMTELRVKEIIKHFSLNENLFETLCLKLGYNTQNRKMLSDGITAMYSRSKIIEIFINDLKEFNVSTEVKTLEDIFDKVSEDFYKNIEKYTKPIEKAIDFVKKLKKYNIKLGIVTSDSVISTKLTLKQFNWENLFQSVIGRENSKETKESGALTKIALKELNSNPNNTIMIGDAPMDSLSAKNANLKATILVASGQIDLKNLENESKYCIDSLDKILILDI